uniref:Wsv206-like protein n=1 Tax=Trachysalambria curvirostris majanivirus TaxID=2984281 RepID=A0A9C7F741_9VIRU|nr:MAG: wsv206-like protein [Trachysalambria curvirostris majanivirus]
MAIRTIFGDITNRDLIYGDPESFIIIQQLNCIATKPHGLSEALSKTYPHSNVYIKRQKIDGRNCAILKDRPKPGTIMICKEKGDVSIANLFAQYCYSNSKNIAYVSQKKYIQNKKNKTNDDHQQIEMMELDNSTGRLGWFKECLIELKEKLDNDEKIKHVLVPYKIGCNMAGGDWNEYLPILENFSSTICQDVTMVVRNSDM